MNTIPKLRRTYWACVKRVAPDPDDADAVAQFRHDFHASLGLPPSTKGFTLQQWEIAVARLQSLAGRDNVRYGHPHLKRDRRRSAFRERIPDGLDLTATPKQLAYIRDLAAQITWHHPDGPAAGLKAIIARNWPKDISDADRDQWVRHGSLDTLDRLVANRIIPALERMAAREAARLAQTPQAAAAFDRLHAGDPR